MMLGLDHSRKQCLASIPIIRREEIDFEASQRLSWLVRDVRREVQFSWLLSRVERGLFGSHRRRENDGRILEQRGLLFGLRHAKSERQRELEKWHGFTFAHSEVKS